MSWRPWRITAWWAKALFVAIGLLAGWPVEVVLLAVGSSAELGLSVGIFVTLVFLIVGARVFRVAGESAEPRPWWQFTGRHRWSLGVATAVGGVLVVYLITAPVSEYSLAEDVISFTAWLLVGVAYLNSGVRLRRVAGSSPTEHP